MAPMPSLNWPLIYVGVTLYCTIWAFVMPSSTPRTTRCTIVALPLMIGLLTLSLVHRRRRMIERRRWPPR